MRVKEQCLEKNKLINKYLNIFVLVAYLILSSTFVFANENIDKIQNHISDINNLSANFIQIINDEIQEGKFYLNKKRIRIDYLLPQKIIIILDKKKAMYYNFELQEVEYFNPEGSTAESFYKIFFDRDFYNSTNIKETNSNYIFSKKVNNSEEDVLLNMFFEKNPLYLRKIEIKGEYENINIGIFDYNFNPSFEDDFFSMANPIN